MELRDSQVTLGAPGSVRTEPCPTCYLCDSPGQLLYDGIKDVLFGAPGTWSVKRCTNRDCGLLWLDPMPVKEDIGALYDAYYTHMPGTPAQPAHGTRAKISDFIKASYLAEHFGGSDLEIPHLPTPAPGILRKGASPLARLSPFFQASLEFPLRALTRKKRGRLLDVGCGNGALLEVAERLGWRAEGIDFDPAAVAVAVDRGLRARPGRLDDYSFAAAAFDLIVLSHVIEHLDDPISTLRECRRLLAPGGSVLVVTPNAESLGHRVFAQNWRGLEVPRHLRIFGDNSLRSTAGRAGFSRVSIRTTLRLTQFVFWKSSCILRDDPQSCASLRGSWPAKVPWKVWFLAESLLLRWRPTAGEELILEAEL